MAETEERAVVADDSEGYLSVSGPGGAGGYRGDAITFTKRRSLKYLPRLTKCGTNVYDMRDRLNLLVSDRQAYLQLGDDLLFVVLVFNGGGCDHGWSGSGSRGVRRRAPQLHQSFRQFAVVLHLYENMW